MSRFYQAHLRRTFCAVCTVCVFSVMLTAVTAVTACYGQTNPWGQWRGSRMDSVSERVTSEPQSSPIGTLQWKFDLPGPAGASPVVWGNKILVSTTDDHSMALLCIGADGKQLWRRELIGVSKNKIDNSNSASASPITDGKQVWVTTDRGMLNSFDITGKPIWSKDLQEDYGAFEISFGMSSTPVLHQGKLYLMLIHGAKEKKLTSEGKLVCLEANSGKEIWQVERNTDAVFENKHSYTSPIIIDQQGTSVLVAHGADYTTGHDVADGKELWRLGGQNPRGQNYHRTLRFVSSPVARDGLLVVPSAKKRSVAAYHLTADRPVKAWWMERVTPDVASPVIYKQYVFLAGENGVVRVLDRSTGKVLAKRRLLADRHRSTPVVVDEKLIVLGRDGTVSVFEADENLKLVDSRKLKEESVASPAVTENRIYIRTSKGLYAFGIK